METAKIFMTGRSQAVRIPKAYRFSGSAVSVRKEGNSLVLTPLGDKITLEKFLSMPAFPDFELDRNAGLKEQERELF